MVSGVDDPPPKITDGRFRLAFASNVIRSACDDVGVVLCCIVLFAVKDFPLVLWLIFFICVTFYMAVFIMIQFGSELVQHRFGINQQDAARIVSVPYLCSAAMSPVLGFLVDRIARSVRPPSSSIALLLSHLLTALCVDGIPASLLCRLCGSSLLRGY
jgi:nitrate/nitrite transporter NarK